MKTGKYIQEKFQAWAACKGVQLQGSKGDRGEPNYTMSVEKNIFGGNLDASVRASFEAGAGGELRGDIPTMSALHSSSAMAVNLFHYWVVQDDLSTAASLLKVPSNGIETGAFEDQFPVCEDPAANGLNNSPHLDFALRYRDGARVGIECKLFEPFFTRHEPSILKPAYLNLSDTWDDIPGCHALAEHLSESSAGFNRLGPSQLIKHILGLKFSASVEKVRLIYLYYDAIGDAAAEHRDEIKRFQSMIANDPVRFVPMSVQEFILHAVQKVRVDHAAYVDYLSERYL